MQNSTSLIRHGGQTKGEKASTKQNLSELNRIQMRLIMYARACRSLSVRYRVRTLPLTLHYSIPTASDCDSPNENMIPFTPLHHQSMCQESLSHQKVFKVLV